MVQAATCRVPTVMPKNPDACSHFMPKRQTEGRLSRDDYTWLSERGYIKTNGDYDGLFRASWQIVLLKSRTARDKLLAVGERIKKKYRPTSTR